MEFVANESKKVEIETSTGVYQRHAIQTHFVQIGENYIDLIERYVKPLYEEGDLLSISEKVIACARSASSTARTSTPASGRSCCAASYTSRPRVPARVRRTRCSSSL